MQPTSNHYQRIGGEAPLRALVQRFYHLMDTLPEAYGIRKLHPQDLKISEDKLFMFLSGWMGGPQLFVQQFGHPMLRRRHFPFPIGESERNQWLLCMKLALEEVVEEESLREELMRALDRKSTRLNSSHT